MTLEARQTVGALKGEQSLTGTWCMEDIDKSLNTERDIRNECTQVAQ